MELNLPDLLPSLLDPGIRRRAITDPGSPTISSTPKIYNPSKHTKLGILDGEIFGISKNWYWSMAS